MGNITDKEPRPPTLDGFNDDDLHPQIVEALKVLTARQEEYHLAVASLDSQYLKPLEAAHDGDSVECQHIAAQVDAVRSLM